MQYKIRINQKKPSILICSIDKINEGAIQTITRAFIEGLQSHYNFIVFYVNRRYGKTTQSNFNLINIYYFFKHLTLWIFKIIVYRPDIVHYHITSYWSLEKSLVFLTIAKIFGCKTIGHLHGGAFIAFLDGISELRKKIAIYLFQIVDHMVVLSEYWKRYLKREIQINHISIVYNLISKKFEKSTLKSANSEDGNMLFLGSIGRNKGVYDIIKAIFKIKKSLKVKVDLVGPEDRKDDLKNIKFLIKRYELNDYVEMKGPLYGLDKVKAFKNAGIFLFPSYNENFPLVIIEAACAGLPIITTPIGALPEFFEHNKSVIFVESGNVEQIAEAIIELINDDEKRVLLGKAAREVFIKKLVRKRILGSLDNIYQSVLRNI